MIMMTMLNLDEPDGRNLVDLEVLVWDPARISDDAQIDSFLIMTRSVMLLSWHILSVFIHLGG